MHMPERVQAPQLPGGTAASNPHTHAPTELHAPNSHFILGKPCKQLRPIFVTVRNSRGKKTLNRPKTNSSMLHLLKKHFQSSQKLVGL